MNLLHAKIPPVQLKNSLCKKNKENFNQENHISVIISQAIDDAKAQKIITLPVSHLTSVTDHMIICTGSSNRHMRHLADSAIKAINENGLDILSTEGLDSNEWMIVDCGDVVLHVMSAEAREFYHLEGLWDIKDTPTE